VRPGKLELPSVDASISTLDPISELTEPSS
jgi:hypothetical protein